MELAQIAFWTIVVHMFNLLHKNSWKLFDAPVGAVPRCSCRKHSLACSLTYSDCTSVWCVMQLLLLALHTICLCWWCYESCCDYCSFAAPDQSIQNLRWCHERKGKRKDKFSKDCLLNRWGGYDSWLIMICSIIRPDCIICILCIVDMQ